MGKEEKKPDRIDMRVYNTIVIFDVYTVGRSPEACRETILDAIKAGTIQPTEIVAKEITMQNSIRASWVDQKPWVAADITDTEFEQIKELTTLQAWDAFYKRTPLVEEKKRG